ncbi:MerR family transcriptional regulator [Ktedonobacteria bacterium brp13]|nr:MerR family transcriptional regulator [Ktedonobacteria bacterium brp13]
MFRIGDFSKIAQVSGRLLRYYDEIGLLSPEFTDPESGYRYYSARQLPRLNRILALKDLGLSLEQIARMLTRGTSTAEIREMLALRKAQIEQSMQEEMERLRVVESRMQQIDAYGQVLEPDVILKSIPPQQFLALREVLPGAAARRRLVQQIFTLVPRLVEPYSLGHIAIVSHGPAFDPQALDLEIGYLLTGKAPESVRLSEEHILTTRTLSAVVTMATFAYEGSISNIHQAHGTLGTWIERKNWQLTGIGREILLQLPESATDDNVLVEVQMPVSKNGAESGG